MNTKSTLLNFMKSQRSLVLATKDLSGNPYVTNLFIGVDENFKIYFVSDEGTEHSQHLHKNSRVGFSTVWFNPENHSDRKGIQGQGVCVLATDTVDIEMGIKLHNKNYPKFAARITIDWVKNNDEGAGVYIIDPECIKYWDDAILGAGKTEIFKF